MKQEVDLVLLFELNSNENIIQSSQVDKCLTSIIIGQKSTDQITQ